MSTRIDAPPSDDPARSAVVVDDLDEIDVHHINRNIELTGDLLQEILADTSILARIPDGASVYVIPADDPYMADVNLEGARRAKAAGQTVYVHYLANPHGTLPSLDTDGSAPERG